METKTMRWRLKLIPECGDEWFNAFLVLNNKLSYPIGMFHVDILDYGEIYDDLAYSGDTEMEVTFRALNEDE